MKYLPLLIAWKQPAAWQMTLACLDDEEKAREWQRYIEKNKDRVNSHLYSFMSPLLMTLLLEQAPAKIES